MFAAFNALSFPFLAFSSSKLGITSEQYSSEDILNSLILVDSLPRSFFGVGGRLII